MSLARDLLELMEDLKEGFDDSRPAKAVKRAAIKKAFDSVMDNKKITNPVMDKIREITGGGSNMVDTLNAVEEVIKDKKLISLAKEMATKIEKLLKAKTIGDVRKISPEVVADFETV